MNRSYGSLKENILKELATVGLSAGRRELTALEAYINEVKEKLRRDNFSLVVLGEFKRGKTTFINALLGAELLPVGVVPLTSIVTEIRYGDNLNAQVVFLNGDRKEIAPPEIAGYVTEEGNPGNAKNVQLVQLAHPSPYLKEGMFLIDTPGVGSIYQNNTDETYSYLPRMDAAVFMLSADQPLSESECGFLKQIKPYAARIFFILNKIDYLETEDRPKALNFTQKALAEKAGFENAGIIPLSAKTALEGMLKNDAEKLHSSNLPVFTEVLERFLMHEKGAAVLKAACIKGINAADELLAGLDLEIKALLLPLEELRTKTAVFERMAAELSREQQDNRYTFRGAMDRVYHELEQEITRFQESQNRLLEKKVEQLYQEKKHLSGRELLQLLSSYIESSVQADLENWLPLLESKIEAAYKSVVTRFTEQTNRAIGELLRQSAGIFEISVEGFTKMEALTAETRLYYIFGAEESLLLPDPVKMSAIFLPRFLAGPKILKEMKKKIERELDRNCGRIRTDCSERIAKSAGEFQKALEEKFLAAVEATRTVLARAAEKRQHSGAEVEQALADLDGHKEQITGAKNRLTTILKEIHPGQ